MCCATDRLRLSAYLVVALAGFIAGLAVGHLGWEPRSDSHGPWPKPTVPHPRTLYP